MSIRPYEIGRIDVLRSVQPTDWLYIYICARLIKGDRGWPFMNPN